MDTAKALADVSALEREKARIEERRRQLDEKKDKLAKKMVELGVAPDSLSLEIKDLEKSIRSRLESAKQLAVSVGETQLQSVDV